MAQARVFISYASEDIAQVRRLYEDLEKRDVNAWFDEDHLRPGVVGLKYIHVGHDQMDHAELPIKTHASGLFGCCDVL